MAGLAVQSQLADRLSSIHLVLDAALLQHLHKRLHHTRPWHAFPATPHTYSVPSSESSPRLSKRQFCGGEARRVAPSLPAHTCTVWKGQGLVYGLICDPKAHPARFMTPRCSIGRIDELDWVSHHAHTHPQAKTHTHTGDDCKDSEGTAKEDGQSMPPESLACPDLP